MLDGFISKGWLSYISFGKISTGGWTTDNGTLYCVKEGYKNKFGKPDFEISYLKHEAQHAYDNLMYKKMHPKDMEYRAKLTELIEYPNIKLFKNFLAQADCNINNSHSYASYKIVQNLSKMIFHNEYEADSQKWSRKGKMIRTCSQKLFEENTALLELHKSETIDII
ncbi:hypothetical protein [Anaeromicropila herbilytica]|uniref:Uncharacterized protein n=1 Tax=Anaeromicropila herbilytica TaxID=2785025 RepID=A0A7R7EKT1_9FIRM|nr:hypothetical protein [Anaeromicropila herbilytica]BCN30660.1 hypothetical protein bsdtb5_19550 [Anaeromicropila herbilytica]